MSVDTYHISSSQNTDIDCEYSMPDGSTCTETHSCNAEGSIIQNSQCGGAKGVTFKPAANAPSGCTIGIHSIGFNCGSASSTVAYSSTPAASSYAVSSSSNAVTTSVPSVGSLSSVISYSSITRVSSYVIPSSMPALTGHTGSAGVYIPIFNLTSYSGTAPIGTATPVIASYGASGSSAASSEVSPVSSGPVSSASTIGYSTSTIYSTQEVTITSCAATVTNW